jgi:hypothetical protein
MTDSCYKDHRTLIRKLCSHETNCAQKPLMDGEDAHSNIENEELDYSLVDKIIM